MTVVSNARADGFVIDPPAVVRLFLVHGSEEGLVNERARVLVRGNASQNSDPIRLVRYEGDEISRHPNVLWDEAYALSLFGGRRAIWIDAQGRDLVAAVGPLFDRPLNDCILIIKAGLLKKGSPLRALFEAAPQAASVECYPDSRETLESLVDLEIRASGLAISAQGRGALIEMLEGDRQTTRNEIAKVILYAHDAGEITRDDVLAILGGQGSTAVDDLIDRTLLEERASVAGSAARCIESGMEHELLMARLAARLTLLYRLRVEMDSGGSIESAQRTFRLPMSAAANLTAQSKRWSGTMLSGLLNAVRTGSGRIRSDPSSARLIITRMLWAVASQAGPSRH